MKTFFFNKNTDIIAHRQVEPDTKLFPHLTLILAGERGRGGVCQMVEQPGLNFSSFP